MSMSDNDRLDALPKCIYCGEPVDGYVISVGGGSAHEDPCTDLECECGHSADFHGEMGDEAPSLACHYECDADVPDALDTQAFRCDCKAWRPVPGSDAGVVRLGGVDPSERLSHLCDCTSQNRDYNCPIHGDS